MGARNPDRIDFSDYARGVETVQHMLERRWQVRATCPSCGLMMSTNLMLLRRIFGPDFSLWDRHPPCRRLVNPFRRCGGKVTFQAVPHPRVTIWSDLVSTSRMGNLFIKGETLNGRPVAPLD
jgi:hypothetical protein